MLEINLSKCVTGIYKYINSLFIELNIGSPFNSGKGYGISSNVFFFNFFFFLFAL